MSESFWRRVLGFVVNAAIVPTTASWAVAPLCEGAELGFSGRNWSKEVTRHGRGISSAPAGYERRVRWGRQLSPPGPIVLNLPLDIAPADR
jgi:hypothetical protein